MITWNSTYYVMPKASCECLVLVDGKLAFAWYSWTCCQFSIKNGEVIEPSHWMTQHSIIEEAE